jgi:hypothetical protein
MLRRNTNIALVLLLGLYYNSVPLAWLSYSTFAEKVFAEHCVNPTKSDCKGKCQVMAMQSKSGNSNKSQATSIRLPQFHPPLPTSVLSEKKIFSELRVHFLPQTQRISSGLLQAPFHPPKAS